MRTQASTGPEAAWRKALQARGREWVAAELKRLPGQPRDRLLEVVFEEPHPTREFCQQWCAEEENHFHLSWSTVAAGALLVIVVVCLMHAVSSRHTQEMTQQMLVAAQAAFAAAPGSAVQPPPTNDVPTPATSSSGTSLTTTSLPSLCAYQSFPTAECPPLK